VQISDDGGIGRLMLNKIKVSVIWSNGGGWEHVSINPYKKNYTPSWDDMCMLKDLFFREDETAIQYHPAKSQYVNNMPHCLHLWRPINKRLPIPPSIMVGVRDGQTMESVKNEMRQLMTDEELEESGFEL